MGRAPAAVLQRVPLQDATALALHVPRHLRVSELTELCGLVPSASSRCVEPRVGGAAILVQLQWQ